MFRKETILKDTASAMMSGIFLLMIAVGNFCIYSDVFTYDGNGRDAIFLLAGAALFFAAIYALLPKAWEQIIMMALVFLLVGFSFRRQIWEGFLLIADELSEEWNFYYGINLSPILGMEQINGGNEAAVLFFLLLLLWWTAVSMFNWKCMITAMIPTLFLVCLELLSGYAPNLPGLLLCLSGGFGILPFCRRKASVSWIGQGVMTAGGLCLCYVASIYFGSDLAQQFTEKQEKMLSAQLAFEDRMMEWELFSLFQGESGRISNQAPQYQEKDVMRVTASELPKSPLYLRGYTGDTYLNGSWKNEGRKVFSEATSDWKVPDVGRAILNMPYQSQGDRKISAHMRYNLEYLDTGNDYAYLPYFTDLNGITGENGGSEIVGIEADLTVFRRKNTRLLIDGIAINDGLKNMEGVFLPTEDWKIEKLYREKYLSRYLEVPSNLPRIRELGKQLNAQIEQQYINVLNALDLYHLDGGGQSAFNREVIVSQMVREAIFERTEYKLDLESVPYGSDVTENFLFDSKEGFCQHYASAGVLLLRELGIPARYVTGYSVPPSAFIKTEADGEYTAYVKDSQAHAWAEIYIKETGWIPVEMTEGQSSVWDSLAFYIAENESEVSMLYHIGQSWGGVAIDIGQYLPEKDEVQPEGSSDREQIKETDNSQITDGNGENIQIWETEVSEQKKNEGNPSGSDGEESEIENRKIIPVMIGMLLCSVILAAVLFYQDSKSLYRIRIKKRLKSQDIDYRRVVKAAASATVHLMKKRGLICGKQIDDESVRNFIRKNYPLIPKEELERYFKITECASFSKEEIGREEAVFCYDLYMKLKHDAHG